MPDSSSRFSRALSQARTALGEEAKVPDKQAMLRTVDTELATLLQQIAMQRGLGAGSSQLADLERHHGDLHALRERIESASSPMILAQLRAQMSESIRGAHDSIQTAQVAASASSGAAALRMASPETRRLLGEGSAEITARTGEAFSLATKYGIDLSDEQERERELKRKEEELRNKGDIHGALRVHVERLNNEIGGYDKMLESGKLSPADQRKIEAHKKKAQEELEKTQREQEKQDKAQGTGQAEQRTREDLADVGKNYDGRDKNAAWAMERWADVKSGQATLQNEANDKSKRQSAEQIAANAALKKESGASLVPEDLQLSLDAAPDVQAKAKHAALPAAAAGTADTSKSADLSAGPKDAPAQTADAGKPPGGRGPAA